MKHSKSNKLFILSIIALFVSLFTSAGNTATLYVGSTCTQTSYSTIQAAINASSSGDTISICPGTYKENNISVNKSKLTLTSSTNNMNDVIIQHTTSNPYSSLMTITQSDIKISALTINSLYDYPAITAETTASKLTLSDIKSSSSNNTIHLKAPYPYLHNVTVSTSGSYVGAIFLNGATNITIDGNNTITASNSYGGYGITDGGNVAVNPIFSGLNIDTKDSAIYIKKSGTVKLKDSSIKSVNGYGTYFNEGEGDHTFDNSTITASGNPLYTIRLVKGTTATFTDVDASYGGTSGGWGSVVLVSDITNSFTIKKSIKNSTNINTTASNTYGIMFCPAQNSKAVFNLSDANITSTLTGIYTGVSNSCGYTTANFNNVTVKSTTLHGIQISMGYGDHVFNNITSTGTGSDARSIGISGGNSATLTDVDATISGNGNWQAVLMISAITGSTKIQALNKSKVTYTATGKNIYGISFCGGSETTSTLDISNAVINSTLSGVLVQSQSGGCRTSSISLSKLDISSTTYHGIEASTNGPQYIKDVNITAGLYGIVSSGYSFTGTQNSVFSNVTINGGNASNASNYYPGMLSIGWQSNAKVEGINKIINGCNNSTGIVLDACLKCSITGTTIDMSSKSNTKGISLSNSSNDTVISGNYIKNASSNGIYINTNRITITGNIIENSATESWVYGINSNYSDPIVYNNCLYNDYYGSKRNANGANFFNSTLKSGNFWGSWPKGSGYSDTCTDSNNDGICDTKYNFNSSYYDNYPLKQCKLSPPTLTTLVAEWRMDETIWNGTSGEVKDNSGNNLNGTANSGTTTDSAKLCNGGAFSKANKQSISIDINDKLKISDAISFVAWIKRSSISTNIQNIYTHGQWDNALRIRSSNKILFELNINGIAVELDSSSVITDTKWHHIVGTYDGSTMKIFIDGIENASKTVSGVIGTTNVFYTIGNEQKSTNYGFDGLIDEVKVWSGALSSAQISAGYINELADKNWDGSNRSCPITTKLIAEYRFDELLWNGTSGEVKDNTSNSLNGTSYGGTSTIVGKICNSGQFTINQAMGVALPASDLLKITDKLTIAAWIKKGDTTTSGLQTIYHFGPYDNYLRLQDTDRIFFGLNLGGVSTSLNTDKIIKDNNWHFITASYDGSNMRIYVDGVEKISKAATGIIKTGNDYGIGNKNSLSTNVTFNGNIDEVKIWKGTLTATEIQAGYLNELAGKNWDGSSRTCPAYALNSCYTDNFNRTDLGSNWNIIKKENFTPIADGQMLYITTNTQNISAGVNLKGQFPASDNVIEIEFDHYAYPSTNGADGVTLILSDASVAAVAGAFGGSLGYAQRSGIKGFTGGWIGVGIDEFGNYSACTEGRDGGNITDGDCADKEIDSIGIRGSGNGTTGYKFLTGTLTLTPGINSSSNPGPGYKYKTSLDTRDSKTLIKIERNTGTGYQTVIDWTDITQQAQAPDNFTISLTGSTGTVVNYHKVDNFSVKALSCGSIGGDTVHHYLLEHDGSALTCQPDNITVKACIDANCTSYYAGAKLTLTSTGNSYWIGGTDKTLSSGKDDFQLKDKTVEVVTIGAKNFNPVPTDTTSFVCYNTSNGSDSCDISFYDSGFVFDIEDNYSCSQQTVKIYARKKDSLTDACVPSFKDVTIPVNFTYKYLSPTTGKTAPTINGVSLDSTVDLYFGSTGNSSFNFSYSDAGRIDVAASYDNGTVNAEGSDSAVFKPYGYYVYTTTPNSEAELGASSSVFKKAGETFNLSVKAVCWEKDSDTDLSNNAVTTNYQKSGASVTHSIIDPSGGTLGKISQAKIDIADGAGKIDNQTFNEVGIVKFQVVDSDYLSSGTIYGESSNIGRFTPANFELSSKGSVINYCNSISYYGYNNIKVSNIKLIAVNTDNLTTKNYKDDYVKFDTLNYDKYYFSSSTGLPSGVSLSKGKEDIQGVWNDGELTLTTSFKFSKPSKPVLPSSPTIYTKIVDNDSITMNNSAINLSNSISLIYGVLDIRDNYETANIPITMETYLLYYDNNSKWQISSNDTCSDFFSDNFTLYEYTGNLSKGETTISDFKKLSAGDYRLKLSAPGTGNDGTVKVSLKTGIYDFLYDESLTPGTATFGVYNYKGKRLFWKEIPSK